MNDNKPRFNWDDDEIRRVAEVLIATNADTWTRLGHGSVAELEAHIKKEIVNNYEKYRATYWGTGGLYVSYCDGQHDSVVVLVTLMPFLIHGYLGTKGIVKPEASSVETAQRSPVYPVVPVRTTYGTPIAAPDAKIIAYVIPRGDGWSFELASSAPPKNLYRETDIFNSKTDAESAARVAHALLSVKR